MSAQAKPRASSSVFVEPSFKLSVLAMPPDDQRKVFSAIRWFGEQKDHKRDDRSTPCEGTTRRRLRYIRTSSLRVIYSSQGGSCTWLWAGNYTDLLVMGQKLDQVNAMPRLERIDVDTMLEWTRGQVTATHLGIRVAEASVEEAPTETPVVAAQQAVASQPVHDVKPPQKEVELLCGAADNAAMFVADAKTACSAVMQKIAEIKKRREAAGLEIAKIAFSSVPSVVPTEPVVSSEPVVPLSEYNKLRAERDIFLERAKKAEKRAALSDFTGSHVEQIRKMTAEEIKTLKRESDKLRTELAAARVAIQNKASVVELDDKAKEIAKEKCAKVCDDQAMILTKTGRPSLVEQAEDLRRIAMSIRALKL